jgi:hypothetical protein
MASIRAIQQKLLQFVGQGSERVTHPGFLGSLPWFFGVKMLRLFGMTTNSNNYQVPSDDDKENEMFAANAPSDPK